MRSLHAFALELDRLKLVERKIRLRESGRFENSAEHSWQLAMVAWALAEHAPPGTEMDRVLRMLLVHDVGEIDAGDVLAFAESPREERHRAELAGVSRVLGLLGAVPAAVEMRALWEEFDAGVTPSARFAHAVDRAMPVLHNLANDGQSWRENGVSYERVVRRVRAEIEDGCPALWAYLAARLEEARGRGWFGGAAEPAPGTEVAS